MLVLSKFNEKCETYGNVKIPINKIKVKYMNDFKSFKNVLAMKTNSHNSFF